MEEGKGKGKGKGKGRGKVRGVSGYGGEEWPRRALTGVYLYGIEGYCGQWEWRSSVMTQTCFRVNKSFEYDSDTFAAPTGWDGKMWGEGLIFERLFTRRGGLRRTSVPLPGGLIKTPEGGRSADTENRER